MAESRAAEASLNKVKYLTTNLHDILEVFGDTVAHRV
jgi:hypothetical protein